MLALSLREIADIVGGSVTADVADVVVSGPAYVDSRRPQPGGLFVAVVGERVDGHEYAAGAHAVLGTRPTEAPTVVVADPVVALGRLARHVVDRLVAGGTTVLALTGSQGKTGTKDYLAQVLAAAGPTVATAGNHNNEIGVPLTVLTADAATRYLVVEMGARGVGHIAYLCEIAPPQVAAVLNVGTAHIGEFGSRDAIAAAKGEIVEALPPSGTAVLNADDPLVAAMATRTAAAVLTFGAEHADATVRASDVDLDDLGRPEVTLAVGGQRTRLRLPHSGLHQVENAAAAAAMALAAGVDLAVIGPALEAAATASPMRMELHERSDGLLVINDAYNANPASMTAAVETLAEIGARRGRRTVAVLGEMRELGDQAHAGHVEVGRAAAALGVGVVVVVGAPAAGIADGLRGVPEWAGEVIVTAGRDEAAAWVRENVAGADVVLVKASRGAALETIADGLLEGDHKP
ncbi:UDP-N-acetylmuramoyl-tripeptide--D-alanyl-D-alanine ligase [Nocardioides sp. LMS-CY]|uniref:UDP-N-acetylmuramoyl-tripeptide--D-alanyl-D- alanine ligase n=1 Tax=Nocardioides sp. (strain LMS-CY) TaxID=2840457 RepID=UPI001C00168F|nr:UDP-N-acetylmuramoyl-tripeptide--D-alanyl-D-alanine ligase [Nocardioides sp. LMS-CY]QWF24178.1 UDP-N-acetylmuramoyl-tripeptide--D-alanyl-D-alanine ligase [Nocardioides sp. LMS-CY]